MRVMHVYEAEGRYTLLRGPIGLLLRELGVPAMRSRLDRGYQLRSERLPDLLAAMQTVEGWAVRLHPGRVE